MNENGNSPRTSTGRYQVPEQLMRELRAATEHFSAARRHMDVVFDSRGSTMEQKEKVGDEVRLAQRELDDVTGKISVALRA